MWFLPFEYAFIKNDVFTISVPQSVHIPCVTRHHTSVLIIETVVGIAPDVLIKHSSRQLQCRKSVVSSLPVLILGIDNSQGWGGWSSAVKTGAQVRWADWKVIYLLWNTPKLHQNYINRTVPILPPKGGFLKNAAILIQIICDISRWIMFFSIKKLPLLGGKVFKMSLHFLVWWSP